MNNKTKRPDWDDYFLEIADAVSQRATCDRGKSGCILTRHNRILVSGYVGSPPGFDHCDEVGHEMKTVTHDDGTTSEHCVRTIHAEQNAICQAGLNGVNINGSTLYIRMTPCRVCAMMLISCGIKRVVCERRYQRGAESEEIFRVAGVEVVYKYDETQEYKK